MIEAGEKKIVVTEEERNKGNSFHEDKWSIGLNDIQLFIWGYFNICFSENNYNFVAIR